MTEHTPGPWNVCMPAEVNARSWTAEQMQHMWWVGKRPGVAIALVDGSEAHSGEADARLIASAPDLLSAAEKAIEALELWPETDWGWREREVYDLLFAAISKARGQS